MDTKVNYAVLGFISVLLIVLFAGAVIWWSMGFTQNEYNIYEVDMHQDVTGLSQDAPVKYNGVQVGYVSSMSLNLSNPQEVILLLRIKQGIPITTSTVATLMTQGVTGIAYIGLSARSPNAPLLKAEPGQQYPIIPTEPSLLLQLSSIVKDASTELTALSDSMQTMLTSENAQNFKTILANLAAVSTLLAQNDQAMQAMFVKSNEILTNTTEATRQLPVLLREADQSFKQLAILTQNANEATPQFMMLLNRLNVISQNLVTITRTMQQNPGVLVRGTELPPLGPGE